MTSELKNSWTLEEELRSIDCDSNLKDLIERYIESMQKEIRGIGNFTGILYRQNLHYILDNLDKPSLAQELSTVCEKDKVEMSAT